MEIIKNTKTTNDEGRFLICDNISTDLLRLAGISFKINLPELAKHVLEDADPGFASKVKPGDIVVGGRNFAWVQAGNTLHDYEDSGVGQFLQNHLHDIL